MNNQGGRVRSLKIGALVCVFLAAIVAANLVTTHVGPSAVPYVAFGLIGLDLVTRDRLSDWWGTTRWVKMAALIAVGGGISYYLNRDASTIALGSTIAFAGSELVEAVTYHLRRRRPWAERALQAAMLGAIVDSALFVSIAFGFNFEIVFIQICAKTAGAVFWTWAIGLLTSPPAVAPAVEMVPVSA